MTNLTWHDTPDSASSPSDETRPTNDPWFGVAMALLGIIAGYVLGNIIGNF